MAGGPIGHIAPTPPDPAAIPVADILGPHGLRGLLRVRPCQPDSPALAPGASLLIERQGWWGTAALESVAPHGSGLLLVAIDGVDDRTSAEQAAKARLLVRAADLPVLEDNEFYWHEVVGFAVETLTGEALGTVADTMSTGMNDVWIVRGGAREFLIPVIADVVRTFDRAGRRIVIDPLPGLLD